LVAHFAELKALDENKIMTILESWMICRGFSVMKKRSEECMFIWVMKVQIQMDMEKVGKKE
jgi:hypothetical protein